MDHNCRTCEKPFNAGLVIDVTGVLCPDCIEEVGNGICPKCNSSLDWKKRGKYLRIGVTSGNWICSNSECGFRINELMMTAFLRRKMARIRLNKIKANKATIKKMYPNANKPWTSRDDERLKDMYENGYSVEKISVNLKRTVSSINSRLKKHNLTESKLDSKNELEVKSYKIKCDRSLLNKKEIEYLEKHGAFMEHLLNGDQKPTTEDQKRFIKVFELKMIPPNKENELTWFKYQKACEWEREGGKISWPIFYENQLSIMQNKNYDVEKPDEGFGGSREDWYRNRRRYDG